MKTKMIPILVTAFAGLLCSNCANGPIARTNAATSSAKEIASDSRAALNQLYQSNPKTRKLASKAEAILVFPAVTKAGLMVGGLGGNGALIRANGSISGYYQTAGLSYGLQAGVQRYGYALFLMNKDALRDLDQSGGWDIGSSPTVVVVDKGMSGSISTTGLNKNVYAVFFNERGLMAGLGLQGSKITRIHPGQ